MEKKSFQETISTLTSNALKKTESSSKEINTLMVRGIIIFGCIYLLVFYTYSSFYYYLINDYCTLRDEYFTLLNYLFFINCSSCESKCA